MQPGGPPVWLGAQSKWAFPRVVEYCDGWMPIGLMGGIAEGMEALRKECASAGRDIESLDRAIFAAIPDEESCRANIELGFTDLMFAMPSVPTDEALPILDRYAELANKLR